MALVPLSSPAAMPALTPSRPVPVAAALAALSAVAAAVAVPLPPPVLSAALSAALPLNTPLVTVPLAAAARWILVVSRHPSEETVRKAHIWDCGSRPGAGAASECLARCRLGPEQAKHGCIIGGVAVVSEREHGCPRRLKLVHGPGAVLAPGRRTPTREGKDSGARGPGQASLTATSLDKEICFLSFEVKFFRGS